MPNQGERLARVEEKLDNLILEVREMKTGFASKWVEKAAIVGLTVIGIYLLNGLLGLWKLPDFSQPKPQSSTSQTTTTTTPTGSTSTTRTTGSTSTPGATANASAKSDNATPSSQQPASSPNGGVTVTLPKAP